MTSTTSQQHPYQTQCGSACTNYAQQVRVTLLLYTADICLQGSQRVRGQCAYSCSLALLVAADSSSQLQQCTTTSAGPVKRYTARTIDAVCSTMHTGLRYYVCIC
jgi:hypothetical protein